VAFNGFNTAVSIADTNGSLDERADIGGVDLQTGPSSLSRDRRPANRNEQGDLWVLFYDAARSAMPTDSAR
jgi:hypothetical protein